MRRLSVTITAAAIVKFLLLSFYCKIYNAFCIKKEYNNSQMNRNGTKE